MINIKASRGFTLIELMVALALGLIVTAAAIQIFASGILSSRLQQANAEIQDSGIFGLDYIVRDIQMANFGNVQLAMNDQTAYGGIVLTGASATNNNVNFIPKIGTGYIDDDLLSRSIGQTATTVANHWNGLSNVKDSSGSLLSDQLTIQFVAPNDMVNCEGRNVLAGDLVVQRYFMRLDKNGTSNTDYALACDANNPSAVVATATPNSITGFGDAGQIVIPRVDQFHVLLGTKTSSGIRAYYTIADYLAVAQSMRNANTNVPRIVSIQISTLVRSANNAQNTAIDPTKSFVMLDQTVTPTDTTTRFQRRVYTSTISLRNGLGDVL